MASATLAPAETKAGPYAWYVLGLLLIVYILNFVDRQILAILADDIKRDLGLKDQDIGFLYGTAFGVFYALFGIPLGRLADSWHRVRLMTLGLALWSTMTALSGFARNGTALSLARIGVGVGEATASPAAYSLISDWFPKRLRATALAIYSSGIYIGGGFSIFIGALIVQKWNLAYPGGGPLGLVGWQAAFMAVGLPGLIVAAWIFTLREPVRGHSEGIATPPHPAPFRAFFQELLTIVPPFTLIGAAQGGAAVFARNVAVLLLVAGLVAGLVWLGEPIPQWVAIGIGVYAVYSWAVALKRRDPPTYALIVGSPAFLCVVVAYGLNAFLAYSVAGFAPSFARRAFAIPPEQLSAMGFWIGAPAALAGFLGITLGGRIADALRERSPVGRVHVILFGCLAPIVPVVLTFTARSETMFYVMLPLAQFLTCGALGASAATTQDLVLPRMRGTATAAFFIGTTLLGLAMGPYLAGRISTLTGDLATGVLSLLITLPIALAAILGAYRWLPEAEATREARARAAGEPI
ncbi:MFS transporter [Sphingomonas sp. JC676]|uniref:spinster family MFS transporter n=1 Tax=Sphingomonas sp. JC676 TaxID=2768065 RepID=UPI001657BC3E|nr:MFS transporter [Sphingomonas sp. JC676]MBC9033433.1 MFS transporter [Sphingomonas sp. JC676]